MRVVHKQTPHKQTPGARYLCRAGPGGGARAARMHDAHWHAQRYDDLHDCAGCGFVLHGAGRGGAGAPRGGRRRRGGTAARGGRWLHHLPIQTLYAHYTRS